MARNILTMSIAVYYFNWTSNRPLCAYLLRIQRWANIRWVFRFDIPRCEELVWR